MGNIQKLVAIAAASAVFSMAFAAKKVDTGRLWDLDEPQEMVGGAYVIKSAKNLAWFAAHVNAAKPDVTINAVLGADIDLNPKDSLLRWVPIGRSSATPFNGTFDGKGHVIKNMFFRNGTVTMGDKQVELKTYAGLFGYISAHGTVKNVKVEGDSIYHHQNSQDDAYTGHIAGVNVGIVDSCEVSSNSRIVVYSTFDNNAYTGGIVGLNGQKNLPGVVRNSTHNGRINDQARVYYHSKQHNVGGIVGRNEDTGLEGSLRSLVKDCKNTGHIFGATSRAAVFTAGIAGANINGVVDGGYNSGTGWVESAATNSNGDSQYRTNVKAAGIVAENIGGDILNSENQGKIWTHDFSDEKDPYNYDVEYDHYRSSDWGEHMVGGIVALLMGGSVKHSASLGVVYTEFADAGDNGFKTTAWVGGIVGRMNENKGKAPVMENVYGSGNVSAKYGNYKNHKLYYGLIAGELNGGSVMTNAYFKPGPASYVKVVNADDKAERYVGKAFGYMEKSKAKGIYFETNDVPNYQYCAGTDVCGNPNEVALNNVGTFKGSSSDTASFRSYDRDFMTTARFAWMLNTTNGTTANSGVWSYASSVNYGFPIFADETNFPAYRVTFEMDGNLTYLYEYSDAAGKVNFLKEKDVRDRLGNVPDWAHFDGWLLKGVGEKVSELPSIDKDVCLVATWWTDSEHPFRVAFYYDAKDEYGNTIKKLWGQELEVRKGAEVTIDETGAIIISGEIGHIENTSVTITPPAKISSEKYDYTFKGWKDLPKVIGKDYSFEAVYDSTLRKYGVVFSAEGVKLTEFEIEYGANLKEEGKIPADPTKEGYRFVGWVDEHGNEVTTFEIYGPASYVASFKKQWTLTYMVPYIDGVITTEERIVDQGDNNLADFPRKGKTLVWSWKESDGEHTGKPGGPVNVQGDMTIQGEYVDKLHTVAYMVDSHIIHSNDKNSYGEDIFLIKVENLDQRVGYDIPQWVCRNFATGDVLEQTTMTSADGESRIYIVMPDNDVLCYTEYVLKSFEVSVAVNDEKMGEITGFKGNGIYSYGDKVSFTAEANEGYSFSNWSDLSIAPEREITVTDAVDLVANFTVNSYNLTYKIDDVVYGEAETVNFNSEVELTVVEIEGMNVSAWNCEGVAVAGGKFTMPAKDVECSATTSPKSYKVTYKFWGVDPIEETVAFGSEVDLSLVDIPDGNVNKGWNCGDVTIEDGKFTMPASDVTCYAENSMKTFTVTVNSNPEKGGSVEGLNFDGVYQYGALVTLKANAAEGFTFTKWSDGVEEAERSFNVEDNVTLTASFTANSYKFSYLAGDKVSENDVEFGSEVKMPEVIPADEGLMFEGWDCDGDIVITEGKFIMPAKDVACYEKIGPKTFTVTFKSNTAEGDKTEAKKYGEEVVLPEEIVPEGMKLVESWNCGESVTISEGKFTMPAKDVTCKNSMEVQTFTVTVKFNKEMGKVSGLKKDGIYEYDEVATLIATALDGYRFTNWNDDVANDTRTFNVKEDIELTANFEKIEESSSSEASSSSVASSSSEADKPASSSSAASSSSKTDKPASSSSKTETIEIAKVAPSYKISVSGRFLQIAGARVGASVAIFDMQGRVMKTGIVDSSNFAIEMAKSGSFLVRIGSQTQRVTVK